MIFLAVKSRTLWLRIVQIVGKEGHEEFELIISRIIICLMEFTSTNFKLTFREGILTDSPVAAGNGWNQSRWRILVLVL